jgi:hypothetical protein
MAGIAANTASTGITAGFADGADLSGDLAGS